MDYPTAAFLAVIALVGLTSVIIYKVRPRHLPQTHTSDITHEDIAKIIELLEVIADKVGTSSLLVRSDVPQSSYVGVQNSILNTPTREKLSKKLLSTADWIAANDPDGKLSVRQVAQAVKVSVGTAQAAIKLVQQEQSIK